MAETPFRPVTIEDTRVVTHEAASEPTLHLSVEQYGRAIRAAFEAGYFDGLYHPKGERVMVAAQRCSSGFWTRIASELLSRRAPSTGGTP